MTALTASPKQRSHWSAPSLEGQRIVLAGRASKWEKEQLIEVIQREKGVVVDQVAADVTLVIVLASGAVPPAVKKAEQLNKKSNASIEIIELEDFEKRLAPTQQEAIEMLRAGAAATERWEQLCTGRNSSLSLEGCDLRGLNLAAFSLENVKLDGADLRKSDLSRSNFDALCNVRLDGAVLAESSAESLENCSLVGADAKEFSVENWNSRKRTACNADFSKAKLVNATFSSVHGPNAKFTKTDLSSADVSECDFSGVDFSGAVLKEAVARKSEFDRCVFAKADLTHFDGAGSSFSGADFRGAKLKNANFFGADLTDALFEGADVSGANFAKAKYDPKQLTRAKGAVAGATTFTPGPRFQELEAAIKKAGNLYITGKLKAGGLDHNCSVSAGKGRGAKAVTISVARGRDDEDGNDHSSLTLYASNVKDAFESLIAYLGPGVVLDPEDVEVSSKSAYLDVARGGFCEPFGVVAPTAEERKAAEKIAKAERIALKKTLAQELQEGATGVKKWNARPAEDFKLLDNLNKLDLTNAQLDGWQLDGEKIKSRQRQTWGFPEFGEVKFNGTSLKNTNIHRIDFTKSSFTGATLQGGRINAVFTNCSFENAQLHSVDFTESDLESAKFKGATITDCNFTECDLSGADLSEAKIQGGKFTKAVYDNLTLLPEGFASEPEMEWCGDGPPPYELAVEQAAANAALAELAKSSGGSAEELAARRTQRSKDYMQRLRKVVEGAKIDKAMKMLKAERFELFVDVTDEHLVGVVKSQSDPDLVYACRLAADGNYTCCTQNLNGCGGLRGSLCKHLLVLAIGLERQDRMPPETLGVWVASSRSRQPSLDKEAMGELLLRYKGAQTGEIDWRPTETTPEDFYAF